MSQWKRRFDLSSFAYGGVVFGLTAVVLTVHMLEVDAMPKTMVDLLTWSLILLCLLALAIVIFKNKISKALLGVDQKTLTEILDDFGSTQKAQQRLSGLTFSETGKLGKEVFAWYLSMRARRELVRAVVAVVGGIALFLSASLIIEQIGVMREQTKQLGDQLEELQTQNSNFERQITITEANANAARVTELVQLLYDDSLNIVVKAMALNELAAMNTPYMDLEGVDLDKIKAPGLDFSGRNLTRSGWEEAQLAGIKLREADVTYARLQGSELGGVFALDGDFRGSQFDDAVMGHGTFTGADFSGIGLPSRKTRDCKVPNSSRLKLKGMVQSGRHEEIEPAETSLRGISSFHDRFTFGRFDETDFTGADLRGTRFIQAFGAFTNFSDCFFLGVDFNGAMFEEAAFDGSTFDSAYFTGTNLIYASFQNITVGGEVVFSRAELNCADFTGAVVEINGSVCLAGADARTATGLSAAFLAKACGDQRTRLPKGSPQLAACSHDPHREFTREDFLKNPRLYLSVTHQEDEALAALLEAYVAIRFPEPKVDGTPYLQ